MSEAEKDFTRQKLAAMDRVRCDDRLSGSIRAVGGELFSLCDFKLGYAYPSEQYLVEKLGLGHRTIKRAVAALKAAGYIEVVKHGRNNVYRPKFDVAAQRGPNWPLLKTEQGPKLPLSQPDRGQKGQEQGPKTTSNRGQKGPPISLEISLGASALGDVERVGAPDGADASAPNAAEPQRRLRSRLGETLFESWFAKIAVVSTDGGTLRLAAPTRFIANYVKTQFEPAIIDCWRPAGIDRLEIVVQPRAVEAAIAEREVSADARWLNEEGLAIIAKRAFVGHDKAASVARDWLQRCGRDATGLRAVLAAADARDLIGDEFRKMVRQETRALFHAGQTALQFPLMDVKRRAS